MEGLSFKDLIRERAIISRGLSVEKTAKLLGCHPKDLSAVLTGKKPPSPKMAGLAVATLGCRHSASGCDACVDLLSAQGEPPARRLVVSVEGLSEDFREWLDAIVRGAIGREWFDDYKRKAGEA